MPCLLRVGQRNPGRLTGKRPWHRASERASAPMATGDPAREGESEPEAASSTAVTWHLVAHTVKQAARTGNRFRAQGKVSCHQGIRTQLQGI